MSHSATLISHLATVALLFGLSGMNAADWPLWGGTLGRNMVSKDTGLPVDFRPGRHAGGAYVRGRAVKWTARLGALSYGTPVVAGGKVYIGTNNGRPRNSKYPGDRGVLMCFRERDGGFLWQLAVPKIDRTRLFNGDRPGVGICSSPAVEGNRVYVVTNRCEILCLDANGMYDGNDGPFRDEARYFAAPLLHRIEPGRNGPRAVFRPGPGVGLDRTDADILWRFDMIAWVRSWPHDAANGSPLVYGNLVFVPTSHGIWGGRKGRKVFFPNAPSLIALNKYTGRLVAVDRAGIAGRTWHGQWSSPSLGVVDGVPLLFYGGGDGWCYAFDARPVVTRPDSVGTLRLVWKYNCNPPLLRVEAGVSVPYKARGKGPSEIIGSPVFCNGRVYVAVGQDPTHGRGPGCLSCIDPGGAGDVTETGRIWSYTGIDRSMSTVSVRHGRVYAADYSGRLHCLDADSGRVLWIHDTHSRIWGSPLTADGHVYVPTTRGDVWILDDAPGKKVRNRIRLGSAVYASPVAANGVLYVATRNRLIAASRLDVNPQSAIRDMTQCPGPSHACPAARGSAREDASLHVTARIAAIPRRQSGRTVRAPGFAPEAGSGGVQRAPRRPRRSLAGRH
ncbi:MAG: PQQ-binding-like beta-propeller repeat protein [Kiritimatiellaeota bacterium]|nr:PQQ-binding-like beta-propeller repeat protein [Kiritimatiellota bacterium]